MAEGSSFRQPDGPEPFGGGLLEKERGSPLDSGWAIKKLEWKEAADTLPQQPEGKIRGIDVN